jgi:imidazolonepropionase-like amidohydrolase/Tol biopolymer transport system component
MAKIQSGRLIFVFFATIMFSGSCWGQGLPIRVARTINFSTDEGSYLDVDISPDNKTLLFSLLGDIYMLPSAGGSARQLTRGLALNLRPIWADDGKRVAFISDTSGSFRVNVIDTGRTFHTILGREVIRLNYETDAIWTPDGNYIVVNDSVYGVIGGRAPRDISLTHLIRFSPDGSLAYYVDSNRLVSYDYRKRVKASISSELKKYRYGVLSPDARWWCYICDSGERRCLMIQNLFSGESKLLISEFYTTDPRFNWGLPIPHFCFSPDSRNIYIGYKGKIHRIDVLAGHDVIIPFNAQVHTDLGALNYKTFRITYDSVNIKYIRNVSMRPDGRQLLFSALNKVYTMNLPNGRPHILTEQSVGQFQPAYSPDGKWVAYVSWCDTVGGYLWRVLSNGGLPEQLTHTPGQYRTPVWSPNGKEIAVIRGRPNLTSHDETEHDIGRLELVSVSSREEQFIADTIPLVNALAFSSDGHRLIYTPKRNWGLKQVQLVSTETDRSDTHVLGIGFDPTFYAQKAMSPDGRYLVYSASEDLFLVPVLNKESQSFEISNYYYPLPTIRFATGVDVHWENGGHKLAWNYAGKFYRVSPDKIIASAEKKAFYNWELPKLPGEKFFTAWVAPDEIIDIRLRTPSRYGRGEIALKNVRIITMKGTNVIDRGIILIKNGRITAVGSESTISVPKGIKMLDFTGLTIMPGLIDLHLHFHAPVKIYPQQFWGFLTSLAYGVTTARDPSSTLDSYGDAERLRSGQTLGPRLFTVGIPLRYEYGVLRADSIEDIRNVVHQRKVMGSIAIKNYLLPTREMRQWTLITSQKSKLNMTNEGGYDPIPQWGMIKDGSSGLEHNPIWGDAYKDVITLFAKSGTWFTPTLQMNTTGIHDLTGKEYFKYKYWHEPDEKLKHFYTLHDRSMHHGINYIESLEVVAHNDPLDTVNPTFLAAARVDAQIRKLGGRVVLGSHGENPGIGTHNELWALQMGGLTNMEALQAGTIMGAEALGVQKDLGSLEVGKIADLIILNKNPLEDIHNSREIRYVMKDGILYDGNTLDEIWPVAKKCPEWRMPEDRH